STRRARWAWTGGSTIRGSPAAPRSWPGRTASCAAASPRWRGWWPPARWRELRSPRRSSVTAEQGVYLYAVTREQCEEPDGLTGVAGAPVRRLTPPGPAAVVGTVPPAGVGGGPPRRPAEDLGRPGEA